MSDERPCSDALVFSRHRRPRLQEDLPRSTGHGRGAVSTSPWWAWRSRDGPASSSSSEPRPASPTRGRVDRAPSDLAESSATSTATTATCHVRPDAGEWRLRAPGPLPAIPPSMSRPWSSSSSRRLRAKRPGHRREALRPRPRLGCSLNGRCTGLPEASIFASTTSSEGSVQNSSTSVRTRSSSHLDALRRQSRSPC